MRNSEILSTKWEVVQDDKKNKPQLVVKYPYKNLEF